MAPGSLAQVLRPLQGMFPAEKFPDLLIGMAGGDDAAVYKITDDRAVIVTVDFITPVVDDPRQYGMIAAANALSDVYAMGGDVLLTLNICAMPQDLPQEMIIEILSGGAEKVVEAGGVLAGGHTVDDTEPKYGMVVVGTVHPDGIFSKKGAQPGDSIILTKPLGVGLVTTAYKGDQADPEHLRVAAEWMMRLNKTSKELLKQTCVHACTDITGFSLLGHSLDMALQSNVSLHFYLDKIEFVPGVHDYARDWLFPAGTCNNQKAYEEHVKFHASIPEETRQLLFTPETSGGLLAAVAPDKINDLVNRFEAAGEPVRIIGEVKDGEGITVMPSTD